MPAPGQDQAAERQSRASRARTARREGVCALEGEFGVAPCVGALRLVSTARRCVIAREGEFGLALCVGWLSLAWTVTRSVMPGKGSRGGALRRRLALGVDRQALCDCPERGVGVALCVGAWRLVSTVTRWVMPREGGPGCALRGAWCRCVAPGVDSHALCDAREGESGWRLASARCAWCRQSRVV